MLGRDFLGIGILVALAAAAGPSAAVLPVAMRPDVDGPAAFARLKSLAGTWRATAAGSGATTTFEMTANGTVLIERYSNPSMPGGGAMTTAYHLDGATLVLTHYCIANNQPTLRAERYDAATGEVQFEFVRASNLKNENAGHMRRALYRFESESAFSTTWEFFQAGRKTMTETEHFTRVR